MSNRDEFSAKTKYAVAAWRHRAVSIPGHWPPIVNMYGRRKPFAQSLRRNMAMRNALGKSGPPLNVVVSGSGSLNLRLPVFLSGQVQVMILTTTAGAKRLAKQRIPDAVEIRPIRRPGTSSSRCGSAYLCYRKGTVSTISMPYQGVTGGSVAQPKCQNALFSRDLRRLEYGSSNGVQ